MRDAVDKDELGDRLVELTDRLNATMHARTRHLTSGGRLSPARFTKGTLTYSSNGQPPRWWFRYQLVCLVIGVPILAHAPFAFALILLFFWLIALFDSKRLLDKAHEALQEDLPYRAEHFRYFAQIAPYHVMALATAIIFNLAKAPYAVAAVVVAIGFTVYSFAINRIGFKYRANVKTAMLYTSIRQSGI